MTIQHRITRHGQALLMLVSFVAVALTVLTAAVINAFINIKAATSTQLSDVAYSVTESGIENALIRVLRDSTYTGETLTVGTGSVQTTVTGANPKTITAVGTAGQFKRTIQVIASDSAGILTVTSWREQ